MERLQFMIFKINRDCYLKLSVALKKCKYRYAINRTGATVEYCTVPVLVFCNLVSFYSQGRALDFFWLRGRGEAHLGRTALNL